MIQMLTLWEGAKLATDDDAVSLEDRAAAGRGQARSYGLQCQITLRWSAPPALRRGTWRGAC
ncbi:MAG: hypothetical protein K0R45_347 [Pseudomonas sp.]|nr:hypothetical protein [Pseudomonas sp.]